MEETKNILTDEQLDAVVEATSQAVNDDVLDVRDVEVEINPDAELETGVMDSAFVTGMSVGPVEPDIGLYDIGSKEPEVPEKEITAAADNVKEGFDLSDAEVLQMVDVFKNIKNPKYKVFPNLPEKLKGIIMSMAMQNKANPSTIESVSRSVISDIMKESNIDTALIDLEKSIDEALNIPSIADMYSEHTRSVMEEIIPKTIEKIKDEYPDKAERLAAVKDAFTKSYNFEVCKQAYLENARLRKAVRRFDMEFNRTLDKFNYMNEKSSFKMNDVRLVPDALRKVLIEDLDTELAMKQEYGGELTPIESMLLDIAPTEDDIKKFCVLVCKYCENMDPNDLIDSTFMYYLMRNIIMLKHSNESKTEFAAELISNICGVITFIRDKEEEFNKLNRK